MTHAKWIVPVLCAAGSLCAQSLGDLNGLITSASHYVSRGMAGTPQPMPLELCKVSGDNGGDPDLLMTRSVDVAHWKFLYRIDVKAAADEDGMPKPKPHRAVIAECNRGVFGGFKYSSVLVTDAKSLEDTWIGVSLQDAIETLNNAGYNRGFSRVTLTRPANPAVPDEYVYVFDCPWERNQVAISTTTGALSWRAQY